MLLRALRDVASRSISAAPILVSLHGPLAASAQVLNPHTTHLGAYEVRIFLPSEHDVRDEMVSRLLTAVASFQGTVAEPADWLEGKALRISLATDLREGLDAWAQPQQRLISVSLDGVREWTEDRLARVLHHELAHLELDFVFGGAEVPTWFREGFAEWAAGGLTCESEIQLMMDRINRQVNDKGVPRVLEAPAANRAQTYYNYYAALIDYVDRRGGGAVTDGRLLLDAAELGVRNAVERLLNTSLEELVVQWWNSISEGELSRCYDP